MIRKTNNRAHGNKRRTTTLLRCEMLEKRLCMAGLVGGGDWVDEATAIRANVSPGSRTIFYDYVEDGVLKGGRVDQDLVEAWCDAMFSPLDASPPPGGSTTIINNGPSTNRIDITIVGDGYTNAELGTYATHVDNILPTFFAEEPLATYSTFFNVHRVDVVSTDSGVDNDPNLGISRNTALDMGYWGFGIERLLIVDTNKAAIAASAAPATDQILALANSTKYGGAGYSANNLGTVAGNNPFAIEVALHEFGHSFADLADEYDYADGTRHTGGEFPEANVSNQTAAQMQSTNTKWSRWLPESNVDSFEGARYNQFGAYRPTANSKMRSLNQPFEQVNIEQFVVSAYKTVKPVDAATAPGSYSASQVLFVDPVDPVGHTLDVQWLLNGSVIAGQTGNSLDVSVLNLPAGTYTVSARVVDNTPLVRDPALRSLWMTETRSWTINAVANSTPVLANFGASVSYTENAVPTKLTSTGTVTDVDSADFATGRLTVTINSGGQPTDRLTVVPGPSISLSGSQVLVGGTNVGTFSGGLGTQPLIVDLGSGATISNVQTLVRNIGFSSLSQNPSVAPRVIGFQVNDGDGGVSAVVSKSVSVVRVNDKPVVGAISGAVPYSQNAAAIRIAPAATVTDVDSANFNGGVLTVAIAAGANASNRLQLLGTQFTVDAANRIYRNGILIGTRNAGAGIGLTDYVISLRATVTPAIAQELVRAFGFRTVSGTSTLQRRIAFTITDGDGGTSTTVNRLVNVS